jgi:hypothetical protein
MVLFLPMIPEASFNFCACPEGKMRRWTTAQTAPAMRLMGILSRNLPPGRLWIALAVSPIRRITKVRLRLIGSQHRRTHAGIVSSPPSPQQSGYIRRYALCEDWSIIAVVSNR